MSRNSVFHFVAIAFVVVVLGGFGVLWCLREKPEAAAAAVRTASQQFRKLPIDGMHAYLVKLASDRVFRVRFSGKAPFFAAGYETPIPLDAIGELCVDGLFRLEGDQKSPKADTDRRLRELIAFSDGLLASERVSPETKTALRERRLDAFFLVGDYTSAIAVLDVGLPGRSKAWCTATAAKLRAHQALEAGATPELRREAAKQFAVFTEYMLSDEMKDFEDVDPATGIVYSREWVAARNLMRCAKYLKEAGDAAAAEKYVTRAKPLFKEAAVKAKDDKLSADELAKEVKSLGL